MKLRLIIRIAMIVSIVLLCTGFGVYSFFRLNDVESKKDLNLYTLVPQSAIAVLETDKHFVHLLTESMRSILK